MSALNQSSTPASLKMRNASVPGTNVIPITTTSQLINVYQTPRKNHGGITVVTG